MNCNIVHEVYPRRRRSDADSVQVYRLSPYELLPRLLSSATTRKRRSLEIINNVCKEQQERGSQDFSIATIRRLSEAFEGPTERTIRNKMALTIEH